MGMGKVRREGNDAVAGCRGALLLAGFAAAGGCPRAGASRSIGGRDGLVGAGIVLLMRAARSAIPGTAWVDEVWGWRAGRRGG